MRQLTLDDLYGFTDLQSNFEVMKYTGTSVMSEEECASDLNKVIAHYENKNDGFQVWAIQQKNDMIGTCAIIQGPTKNEIGYRIRQQFWGNGFGTEITKSLIDYSFNELKLENIYAEVDVLNLASVKILDRLLIQTGKVYNKADQCWDYQYSLSKKDYEKRQNHSSSGIL